MKTRKLLAVVVAVAMLASFISIPVAAEGEGAVLEDLGILVGTGGGVTADYLASTATRAQAALIHLRLFGLEEDALAYEGDTTFADAATATEYWQPVLEYLKANPELGWRGDTAGNFMPTAAITGQQFTKVLLVALGYVEDTDFTYDETMTFAAGIGLDALADKADMDLTMNDVAVALVQALGLKTTGVEDWTLISQLVHAGLVDATAAEAAGFEVMEPAFVVTSAEATAVDEVTVTTSTDIPDGATIILKKGTIGIVTTKEVDGNTAVLTGMYNFLPGTYTVTVNEAVSAEFEITAQTATELTVGAETIFDEAGQDLMVKLADQYGDPMDLSGVNASVFNQSNGFIYTLAKNTTIKIDPTEGGGEAGDTVYVFVYDPVSQLQVTATVLIVDAPVIAGISIEGYTWNVGDEDDAMFYTDDTTALLDVECVDQYGNPYELTAADLTEGSTPDPEKVQVLVSNPSVLDVNLTTLVDGDLQIAAVGTPGSVIVTLVLPSESIIEQSEMITVYALPELDSLTVADPSAPSYAGEESPLPAFGFDQYGNPADFDEMSGITFTVNNTMVISSGDVWVDDTNSIVFYPHAAGNVTIFVFLGGELQGQVDVTVQPEAYPFAITAVDTEQAMETGVWANVTSGDVTVIDQYGRVMTDPFMSGWHFTITNVTSSGALNVTSAGPWDDFDISTVFPGAEPGTDTFVANLWYDGDVITTGGFQFDVTHVGTNQVDGFTMGAIDGPMYTGDTFVWGQTAPDYYKTVSIKGTADGLAVKLYDGNDDGLPDLIDLVTSSNDAVEVMSGSILVPSTAVDGTTTVKAWRNGVAVAMTDLGLSDTAPDLAAIAASTADTVTPGYFYQMFLFTDQYGVSMDPVTVIHANSPDGLVPLGYTYELTNVVDADGDGAYDDVVYTVVKWDGSVKADYTDLNSTPNQYHVPD